VEDPGGMPVAAVPSHPVTEAQAARMPPAAAPSASRSCPRLTHARRPCRVPS
jgi:hypothetical protein